MTKRFSTFPKSADVRPLGTPKPKASKISKRTEKELAHDYEIVAGLPKTSVHAADNRGSVEAPDSVSSTSRINPVSEKEFTMSFTLTRGKVSKNGKRAQYTSSTLPIAVTLPARLFAGKTLPESFSLDTSAFLTMSADEQARAEARNARRAEKGLKPKATPEERKAKLDARIAKTQAKLDRARKAAEKLAGRSGAPTSEPVSEPVSATV